MLLNKLHLFFALLGALASAASVFDNLPDGIYHIAARSEDDNTPLEPVLIANATAAPILYARWVEPPLSGPAKRQIPIDAHKCHSYNFLPAWDYHRALWSMQDRCEEGQMVPGGVEGQKVSKYGSVLVFVCSWKGKHACYPMSW